ncbi:MAG TPA: penicillin-binding transpeptidase domain-containing protein [Streptosporangiaceae bacterium]
MSFHTRDRGSRGSHGSHARTGRPARILPRPGRSTAPPPSQRPPLPPRPLSARSQQKARRLSMRARRIRLVAILVTLGVVIAGFLDGFGQESSPEGTVQAFLLAWQQHNYQTAASYTTGPEATVAGALSGAFTQLDATALFLSMGSLKQHGNTADAHFAASVNLGEGGHQWDYSGRFELRRLGSDWKVAWAPSVINPQLGPGERLAVVTQVPARAAVLSAQGQPLQVPSAVYQVGVWPKVLKNVVTTAGDLANVTQLNPTQVLGQIQAAPPGQYLVLLSLDPASYAQLSPMLAKVPGLAVHRVSQRLFSSEASEVVGTVGTEASSQLRDEGASYQPGTTVGLTGLQAAYQHRLAGSPTTEVVAENASGQQSAVLRQWRGSEGAPITTTISQPTQAAATAALNAAPNASAEIVAVQASTGKVLATAGQQAPGPQIPAGGALDAHVSPGTAFTIVSTAALLGTGFSTGTPVPCTSTANVGGQLFSDLGASSSAGPNPTFSTDFAQGCSTAFAGLSRRLNNSDLTQVGRGFGLGTNWQLPVPAYSGSVPTATSDAQRAGVTIGQGVTVSPLGMALVAAAVDTGVYHGPMLVTSPADAPSSNQAPLSASALSSLRSLMRATVTSGTGQSANVSGAAVHGQTALIQTGSGRHTQWQSWFVGFRGDTAFAILVTSRSSDVSASSLAGQFLRALPGARS